MRVQPAATVDRPPVLADAGGPNLAGLAVAGLFTVGGVAMVAAAHRRRG